MRALKRKKVKEELENKPKKEVDKFDIFNRTCFICLNRHPQTLTLLNREIDTVRQSIRVYPSCQLGMTKFLPIRADMFITSVSE